MKQRISGSYAFKQTFQNSLNPAKQFLIRHKITPNSVTLLSFFFMVTLTLCLMWQTTRALFLFLTPFFMSLKITCNALDGMIARETNQQTKLGACLNESTDFIADLLVLVALYSLSTAHHSWPALLFMVILIEATGLLALFKHNERRHFGPFSKSDRAIYISIVALGLCLSENTTLYNSLIVTGIVLATITWWQQLRYWLSK